MAVFNFELLRTYSTMFEIEADTQLDAIRQFKEFGDSIYTEEMQQCNVIEESVKGDKYARCCTCCGDGMNEGYFANYEYFCSDKCLHTQYTAEEWEELASDGVEAEEGNDNYYWTEWEDEEEYEYQFIDGELKEIENVFLNKVNENLGFR
jgi:hypothetical protein